MKKCRIIVKDEVNVKIEDLDLDARKKLAKMLKFELPYARHMPSFKLGRWDGCVSFFSLSGGTYLNLLPEILPVIESYNYSIEVDDQRRDFGDLTLLPVDENTFAHKTWPKGHVKAGEPVILRDYQIEVVNSFLADQQCLQEVATGAGKTLITATLSASVEKYGRSIVIVPNKSLVGQTEDDYINLGLDVGVYFGDRKEVGKTHTICTWQSLNTLMKNSKGDADGNFTGTTIEDFVEDVICVIVDEAHQAKADALKALLTGPFANVPIRWGLTGTIPKEKSDSVALRVSLGEVVNRIAASELQDKGVLAMCHVKVLQTQDTKEFRDFPSETKYLLGDQARLDWMAAKINEISLTGNTLVMVNKIDTGKFLSKATGGIFVSGSVKVKDRKETYDDIQTATNSIIIATYGVAAVGINIPRIFNLVMIEPGKSFVRVIQSIGRGVRKAEDKDFVQIWDITSKCKFSKRHLTQRKTFYREASYPFSIEKVYIE